MNFDKANTEVTRHSYGSRVDKEFKREGVIPVKNRNKNDVDYAAETAKYNELNKKVENRRFNDIKEQKSFDEALSKGYDNLRESLLKDIMYEICIESMWVDRDNIDNNIRNVMNLVDEQVEAIGGYKGFKEIAESTNNQLLLNMVKDCEEMCKIVGIRNITEAAGNASKLDFEMNKAEMDEFDYRKKSFGSETIINAVRDKVLDVVKYEQEANTAKQEVMDEIQMKAGEIGAPVGEAMEFIFNEKIEETTLFDSLMRKNYKNLLETNCSYIFESEGVDEEDYEFEDDEFKMSDIELTDEEDEEDIKNMFLENAYADIKGLMNESEEVLEESLKSILETLNTMTSCKSKSDAIRVKNDIRGLQYALEEGLIKKIKDKMVAKAEAKANKRFEREAEGFLNIKDNEISKYDKEFENVVKYISSILKKEIPGCVIKSSDIKKEKHEFGNKIECLYRVQLFEMDDKSFKSFAKKSKYAEMQNADEPAECSDEFYQDMCERIVDPIKSKGFEEEDNFTLIKSKNGKKYMQVDISDELFFSITINMAVLAVKDTLVQESNDSGIAADNIPAETAKGKNKVKEEVIMCPDCKKDPCTCKGVKESFAGEPVTEGVKDIIRNVKKHFSAEGRQQLKNTKELKKAVAADKENLQGVYNDCKGPKDYTIFVVGVGDLLKHYSKLMNVCGNEDSVKVLDKHCVWLKGMIEKAGLQVADKVEINIEAVRLELNSNLEPIVEGVLKNKIVMAYDNYKNKKLNKVDFEKLRNSMIQIAANAKTIKDLDVLDRDVDFSIAELEKMKKPENEEKVTFHIEFLNKEYKKFLAEKREEMNKQKCVESFVDKLDNYCDKLSHIIESHELARNSAVSSLTYEIEEQNVFVPYIQPNDCNLSNLEFAYKAKMVCESLKSELKNVNNENDFMIIEKAVDMNLQSIHESLEAIKDMEKMDYKKSTLKSCEGYLNKIKHVIDNNVAPNNPVVESTSIFGSDDDVERIFNRVKEYTLIESTNNKLMETVMAESIVEYTIIEAFNTLNLLKFDKESVRRMSRNNLK